MSESGFGVVLSDVVVDTHVPAYTLPQFFEHQLRWARSTRHSRRWGYAGLVLTFAPLWALAAVAASGGALWSWALLGAAMLLRLAVALEVGWAVLRDRQVLRNLWLVPFRD